MKDGKFKIIQNMHQQNFPLYGTLQKFLFACLDIHHLMFTLFIECSNQSICLFHNLPTTLPSNAERGPNVLMQKLTLTKSSIKSTFRSEPHIKNAVLGPALIDSARENVIAILKIRSCGRSRK